MKNINFHTCIYAKGKLWFITNSGYFMNLDTTTGEVSFVNKSKSIIYQQVTDTMVADEDCIYWVEQDGKRLFEYNIRNNECEIYPMPEVPMINWSCFATVCIRNHKINFFAKYTNKLIVFNTKNKQFSEKNEIYHQIQNKNENNEIPLIQYACQDKDEMYLFLPGGNKIIKYNLDNENSEQIQPTEPIGKVQSAVWKHNILYILTTDGEIYLFNRNFIKMKEIKSDTISGKSYGTIVLTDTKLFVLPALTDEIQVVNLNHSKVETLEYYPSGFKYENKGWWKYIGYTENNQYIWIANRMSNYILRINKGTEQIEWWKMQIPSLEQESEYCSAIGKIQFMESETDLQLLFHIKNKKSTDQVSCYGKNIWNILKESSHGI